MTNAEAKKRIEIQLKCMECDENTLCYGSDLVTICDVYDDSVRLSLKEALKVAIKALSEPTIPLSVIEDIKTELPDHSFWQDAGGEPLVAIRDVLELIDRTVKEISNDV